MPAPPAVLRLLLLCAAVAWLAPRGGATALRAPASTRGRAATTTAAASRAGTDRDAPVRCASCHATIAREWRRSLHARSWTDPEFSRSYALEPLPMCVGCHAPEPGARDEGVACAQCHAVEARTLAARGHATAQTPATDASPCAACHEFAFPDDLRDARVHAPADPTRAMQRTAQEWAASPAARAGVRCVDCHMPLARDADTGRAYRSHALPGGHDPALLAQAIVPAVTAQCTERRAALAATLRAAPRGVGHAVPTGDLFRRVVFRAWLEGAPRSERRVVLHRRFADDAAGAEITARRERFDSRLAPGDPPDDALRVRWRFARSDGRVLRWALDYERPLYAAAPSLPDEPHPDAPRVRVHEGRCAPVATRTSPARSSAAERTPEPRCTLRP